MSTWLNVGPIKDLNVPYFAVGLASQRKSWKVAITDRQTKLKILGKKAAWLHKHLDGKWQLIHTRNFTAPTKTAIYSYWLVFESNSDASLFLSNFPDISNRLQAKREEKEALVRRLDRGLSSGGYDLSRLPENQRMATAQSFVDKSKAINDVQNKIEKLERSFELAEFWENAELNGIDTEGRL